MDHMRVWLKLGLFLLACLAASPAGKAQSEFQISEIMPANTRTLADEDGDFSDWIEIYNPQASPANLGGYYLTDDSEALAKWAFPAVTLPPKGYLVVFASGKNRVANPARLHTNFKLNADGGFLALVKPDGATFASAFSPRYPKLKDDVAYGTAQNVLTMSLLDRTAPQVLVPDAAGDLPSGWNTLGYEPDAAWIVGFVPPALGFDTNQPLPAPSNLARGGVALQSTTYGNNSANLAINGSTSSDRKSVV